MAVAVGQNPFHFHGQLFGPLPITAAYRLGRLENSCGYAVAIIGDQAAISFSDLVKQRTLTHLK